MKIVVLAGLLIGLIAANGQYADSPDGEPWPNCGAVDGFPGEFWTLGDAEALGWDASALDEAVEYLDTLESSGVMVVHRGSLIAQWGAVGKPHTMASLRKSVLSGLIGTYIDTGEMDVERTLADFGVDDSEPSLTAAEKQATFLHLINARSGIYHSAHYETGGWKRAKVRMAENGGAHPGDTWLYNNWDFNTAASILEREVGETLGEGFARRIAGPTGMQDFTSEHVTYVGNESYAERSMGNLSDFPAYMFEMSVRDLARYGLMFMNCGRWGKAQVIPEAWVLQSIRGRPIVDGAPNVEFFQRFGDYGYMWWVDKPGSRTWPEIDTREPVYFGQGANGHFLWIAPYLDLVVVHQVATPGGLGSFDQARRRMFGQPNVTDDEFKEFLVKILAAHPDQIER